jgi:hypothetical protein
MLGIALADVFEFGVAVAVEFGVAVAVDVDAMLRLAMLAQELIA